MWIGAITTFFMWWLPMKKQIRDLQEGMHDCIKAGLTNNNENE